MLQPFDITLSHGRGNQRARKSFLAFSVLLLVGLPLWHLRALELDGAGVAADTRWSTPARLLSDHPPPFFGAPTSVRLGLFELVDPLQALATALFGGLSWSLMWTVPPGVSLVLALVRFFCGWACPYLPILAASNAGVPALLPGVPVPRSRGGGRRPLFHADACVGGGLCEEACPEIAQAIVIEPIPHEA